MFKPEYTSQAIVLIEKTCANNKMLAAHFKVDPGTISHWLKEYPEFAQAIESARESLDSRVERALAKRALGVKVKATKIFRDNKTGEIATVPYTEHYPPDTEAAKFWLTNRRPDRWRNKQEIEHTGQNAPAITADEAARLIAFTLEAARIQGPQAPAPALIDVTPAPAKERVNPFA